MYDAAQDMAYLDMVVQETLRMYPMAPVRECVHVTFHNTYVMQGWQCRFYQIAEWLSQNLLYVVCMCIILSIYIKRSWKWLSANSSRARNQIATKPPQHFATPTVEFPWGGNMCKYASAKERVTKNQKRTVRHFVFTEKVYGLPCTVRTFCGSAVIVIPSWDVIYGP